VGKIRLVCCFLLCTIGHFSHSQDLKVEGYFLQDSAMLGERVGYVLKATYPSNLNVLFPDSSYQYGSMEFLDKQIFTSYTQDSTTLDSAVYYLSNFSLEPVKQYRLPVFEVLRYDSISHFPQDAALHLKLTIEEMPEELEFKETNRYQPIDKDFNYIYLIIGLVVLLVLAVVLFLLFGKRISKSWKIYQEKRRQKRFIARWNATKRAFISQPTLDHADELLGLWKARMENLTGEPFKEWTATEIAEHLEMPEVLADFRKIELIIYAARPAEDVEQACDHLEAISTSTYQQKIKALR
jgi:hypothetical protein